MLGSSACCHARFVIIVPVHAGMQGRATDCSCSGLRSLLNDGHVCLSVSVVGGACVRAYASARASVCVCGGGGGNVVETKRDHDFYV
jgi:hypothetical protein